MFCCNGVVIFLSEISRDVRIVTQMLGYNPLCLRERQTEREGGGEGGRREGKEGGTETQAKDHFHPILYPASPTSRRTVLLSVLLQFDCVGLYSLSLRML